MASTPVTTGSVPVMTRKKPAPSVRAIIARKKYVGTAKIRPLSFTPRRLMIIISRMKPTASSTR